MSGELDAGTLACSGPAWKDAMPLTLLAKLGQSPLPVTVTCKADLKRVSVLKATGMIETSLALSGSKDRYDRKIDAALIVAITKAGMDEISVIGAQSAAPTKLMEKNNLALEYLRLLDNSDLPVQVSEPWMLECVQALSNAGLLLADFEEREAEMPARAIARRITEVGHDFLHRRHGKSIPSTRRRDPDQIKNWIEQLPECSNK